jgi:uncharacterized protein DUF3455
MSIKAKQSMEQRSGKPVQTQVGSRAPRPVYIVVGVACAGLQALLACSDAAIPPEASPAAVGSTLAQAPTPPALAPSPPAPSTPSPFDAPWLTNVANSQRSPAQRPIPCPARVPEALNPPADATLELAWPASGVQIYACTQAKPTDPPSWSLEGPHALLTSGKAVAAIHFAGPSWQGLDGSQVKGTRLAAADAPNGTAVPWLLMSASASGEGTFAHTTHIQRLDTTGGKAPTSGCDAAHLGAKVLVPYQASYFFYRHANGGETIHQCRSGSAKPAKAPNP